MEYSHLCGDNAYDRISDLKSAIAAARCGYGRLHASHSTRHAVNNIQPGSREPESVRKRGSQNRVDIYSTALQKL